MIISKKMQEAINGQINEELYSAYLYLSMSADFSTKNFSGFANWMRVQAGEELEHAMKFYEYVLERGGVVDLHAIAEPPKEWNSPLEAFKAAYGHEKYITDKINNLMELAISENDYATINMLQWFVNEQVEEEASTDEVVERLRMTGDTGGGLFMLDRELGQRKSD